MKVFSTMNFSNVRATELDQMRRKVLLNLTDNEDNSVALMAAVSSLKYNPLRTTVVLNKLAKKPGFILAFKQDRY